MLPFSPPVQRIVRPHPPVSSSQPVAGSTHSISTAVAGNAAQRLLNSLSLWIKLLKLH